MADGAMHHMNFFLENMTEADVNKYLQEVLADV